MKELLMIIKEEENNKYIIEPTILKMYNAIHLILNTRKKIHLKDYGFFSL